MAQEERRHDVEKRYTPVWRDEGVENELAVTMGREALNRSVKIKQCYDALEGALAKIRVLPGGKEQSIEIEKAAMTLQIHSVDLAATVAASAARQLDAEQIYAAAVMDLPVGHDLLTIRADHVVLAKPFHLKRQVEPKD